ncbi:MAG: YhbY family RNA-binding protein, partial [Noviherbaspirillum sp.]
MLKLTPAERSALRSDAHALNPVVIVGEAGLTPSVLKEIDTSLNAHGLIKVRVFGDDRDARI